MADSAPQRYPQQVADVPRSAGPTVEAGGRDRPPDQRTWTHQQEVAVTLHTERSERQSPLHVMIRPRSVAKSRRGEWSATHGARWARRAASISARVVAPSFWRIFATWCSTVLGEM